MLSYLEFEDLMFRYYCYKESTYSLSLYNLNKYLDSLDSNDKLVSFFKNHIMDPGNDDFNTYEESIFYNFFTSFLRTIVCAIDYEGHYFHGIFDSLGFLYFIKRDCYLNDFHLDFFEDYLISHIKFCAMDLSFKIGDCYG